MVMPQLKSDLATLKSLPNSMIEDSANIQEILNVYQTLEKHNRTELIDLSFIQELSKPTQAKPSPSQAKPGWLTW